MAHWAEESDSPLHATPPNIKYIDPTYMVRAVPANPGDNIYCAALAHAAVHGAFAGYTAFMTGTVNAHNAYIPLAVVANRKNVVSVKERQWARLVAATGQPDYEEAVACDIDYATETVSGGCAVADDPFVKVAPLKEP